MTVVTFLLLVIAVVGCGSGSKRNTSRQTGTGSSTTSGSSSKAAFFSSCDEAQFQAIALGGDAGSISTGGTAAANKAVSDADSLKTTLTELRGDTSSTTDQAQIDQYQSVISRFEQSVQAFAGGDYQTAIAQLTGIATEFGQMLSGLRAMCAP